MPCYHPVKAYRLADGGVSFVQLRRHDVVSDVELPCGQCVGCRLERARAWTIRCVHEASLYKENCFITLTYSPGNLPPHGDLRYFDFQCFMRRLRKEVSPKRVRFYMCGEYGGALGRPHYHACLFGHSFRDSALWKRTDSDSFIYTSPSLDRLWGLGLASVGEFNSRTAGYTARYVMKKITGQAAEAHYGFVDPDTGEILHRTPEFTRMSLRPGIGAPWFDRYSGDVYPHDFVVSEGKKAKVPRYYDKLYHREVEFDQVQFERELRARSHADDQTPERLAVKETVCQARISTLRRTLE